MKKALLITSIAIIISGCNDNSTDAPGSTELRNVSVNYQTIELGEQPLMDVEGNLYVMSEDSNGYYHWLINSGYKLCIDDNLGHRCIDHITIDNAPIAIEVAGEATISVTHDQTEKSLGLSKSYTLTGNAHLTTNETNLTIEMKNTEWAYVTMLYAPSIIAEIPEMLNSNNEWRQMSYPAYGGGYWYEYVNTSTKIKALTREWNYLNIDLKDPQPNKHYAYYISESPKESQVGFVIKNQWEEPTLIEIK